MSASCGQPLKTAFCHCVSTKQGPAWILDECLSEEALEWIDAFRLSLPLDSKRPTVDRRFFCDDKKTLCDSMSRYRIITPDVERPIASLLEGTLEQYLPVSSTNNDSLTCRIFRYQRFIEYTKSGLNLAPHSDGTKICDDTGLASTHTMLLYLTDCEEGGETMLLHSITPSVKGGNAHPFSKDNLTFATQPKRGRILLFPHATPHAGASVVSIPKICLRAEVRISTLE
ncbi:2(OG)-Fe(II) oxygenase superfamily protein [Nitzschia inconspicua]|uniref:2(OG)-Fe(II) oxygenase superfamily protein n=1 Tax=Nitzschia inconspicua TaxID=303405 RepID=A0A9K3PR53_9STRA|nr:2(OG)-Fe(II) oxygenase superfamily protein [Nitzschia inconspicua]